MNTRQLNRPGRRLTAIFPACVKLGQFPAAYPANPALTGQDQSQSVRERERIYGPFASPSRTVAAHGGTYRHPPRRGFYHRRVDRRSRRLSLADPKLYRGTAGGAGCPAGRQRISGQQHSDHPGNCLRRGIPARRGVDRCPAPLLGLGDGGLYGPLWRRLDADGRRRLGRAGQFLVHPAADRRRGNHYFPECGRLYPADFRDGRGRNGGLILAFAGGGGLIVPIQSPPGLGIILSRGRRQCGRCHRPGADRPAAGNLDLAGHHYHLCRRADFPGLSGLLGLSGYWATGAGRRYGRRPILPDDAESVGGNPAADWQSPGLGHNHGGRLAGNGLPGLYHHPAAIPGR